MKSRVAADAVKRMNSKMNITPYTDPISKETENIFHDSFFQEVDGVVTALDNVKARLYSVEIQFESDWIVIFVFI